jgi:hypothetical protein
MRRRRCPTCQELASEFVPPRPVKGFRQVCMTCNKRALLASIDALVERTPAQEGGGR